MIKLDAIYISGNSAYWDGYPADRNHYTRGSEESKAWAKGWAEARREEMSMKDELGITKPSVPVKTKDKQ